MTTAIMLDERHFKAATQAARELGTTPERYIESLIDAAQTSLDDILAPVREEFRQSGMTEDELDAAVNEARRAINSHARRAGEK
jgi:hypothetical protein